MKRKIKRLINDWFSDQSNYVSGRPEYEIAYKVAIYMGTHKDQNKYNPIVWFEDEQKITELLNKAFERGLNYSKINEYYSDLTRSGNSLTNDLMRYFTEKQLSNIKYINYYGIG